VKGLLLGYGYDLAEFSGEVRTRASSARAVGIFSSDSAKTEFTVASPHRSEPMTAACAGGQSRTAFAWIEFQREDLAYVCEFAGGPPDASFALALSKGGLAARLYQPQRAAEMTWNGATLRARTARIPGSVPFGSGGVLSYVVTRDGEEIAGLVRGALKPTFYLPPEGSSDREAAAVLLLALYTFADPADRK
jgi:hypothetical protein